MFRAFYFIINFTMHFPNKCHTKWIMFPMDPNYIRALKESDRGRERVKLCVCVCVENPLLKIFVFNALTSMVKTDISSNNKRHRNVLREKERWNWIETGKMGWRE